MYSRLHKHMEGILESIDSGRANPDKVLRALVVAVKLICEDMAAEPYSPSDKQDNFDFAEAIQELLGKGKQ